jgi:hypothetical protein
MGATRGDGGILERSGFRLIVTALACAACGGDGGGARAYPIPGERGGRLTVEVLNATGKHGLARAGALTLRRAGIDVVYFGNAPESAPLDSTRILVRRGSLDAGTRVRGALKAGRVILEPDSARLLDVTVVVGRDFTPGLDFHP